jgi:rod shape-determining protein MreC
MPGPFFPWRRALTLALAPLAALLSILASDGRPPGSGALEAATAVAMAPLQAGAGSVFSWLGGLGGTLFGRSALRRENAELREEVARLHREVQESRERVAAAARLEQLLGYKERSGFTLTAAAVIGHDAAGLYRTVLVDRGAADGVQNNQAVLSPDGVVGRVIKTFPRSALVLLITDRSSGLDALIQRTRDRGVVHGRGGSDCELKYLDRSAEVEVGDRVVTSGLGGYFPKGVLIGQVGGITRGGELFQSVEVRPAAALERLEEIVIVTGPPAPVP